MPNIQKKLADEEEHNDYCVEEDGDERYHVDQRFQTASGDGRRPDNVYPFRWRMKMRLLRGDEVPELTEESVDEHLRACVEHDA